MSSSRFAASDLTLSAPLNPPQPPAGDLQLGVWRRRPERRLRPAPVAGGELIKAQRSLVRGSTEELPPGLCPPASPLLWCRCAIVCSPPCMHACEPHMPHAPPRRAAPQVGRYIQSRGGTVVAEELAPFLDLKPGQLAADRSSRITGAAQGPVARMRLRPHARRYTHCLRFSATACRPCPLRPASSPALVGLSRPALCPPVSFHFPSFLVCSGRGLHAARAGALQRQPRGGRLGQHPLHIPRPAADGHGGRSGRPSGWGCWRLLRQFMPSTARAAACFLSSHARCSLVLLRPTITFPSPCPRSPCPRRPRSADRRPPPPPRSSAGS